MAAVPQVPEVRKTARRSLPLRVGVGAVLVVLSYQLITMYYYYYDFKAVCSLALRSAAVESDEELKRNIVDVLQERGISKQPRDIGVQRLGRRIRVWFTYKAPVQLSFGGRSLNLFELEFTPSAEGNVSE